MSLTKPSFLGDDVTLCVTLIHQDPCPCGTWPSLELFSFADPRRVPDASRCTTVPRKAGGRTSERAVEISHEMTCKARCIDYIA